MRISIQTTVSLSLNYSQKRPKSVANFVISVSPYHNHTASTDWRKGLSCGRRLLRQPDVQRDRSLVPSPEHELDRGWLVLSNRTVEARSILSIWEITQPRWPLGSLHGYAVFAWWWVGLTPPHVVGLPTHYSNTDGMTEFDKPWPVVEYIPDCAALKKKYRTTFKENVVLINLDVDFACEFHKVTNETMNISLYFVVKEY